MKSNNRKFTLLCDELRFSEDKTGGTENINRPQSDVQDYLARARAHGLRISPTLTPKLFEMIDAAKIRLGLENTLEAFVVADPQPNAFAPIFGDRDYFIIVFTSGLIDLMDPTELLFVIGHELGHLGLDHVSLKPHEQHESELEALKHRSLERCCEISADRIGLIAARSLFVAASVMIKLASGLNSRHVKLDVNAFLAQMEQHPEGINRDWELESSYPSLPLRLWSLIQFSKSDLYLRYVESGTNGTELKEIDKEISVRLNNLGGGKLKKMHQHKFDMAITWMGASLALEDGVIEEYEEYFLEQLVGETLAQKALTYAKNQGITAVYDKFESSLNELFMLDNEAHMKVLSANLGNIRTCFKKG